MKWFFAYADVSADGAGIAFGHVVGDATFGHPIERVAKWNEHFASTELGRHIVLLSFQEVPDSMPNGDVFSRRHC